MAVALVCVFAIIRSISEKPVQYCYRILDPVKHVEFFPLPLPISRSAHEVVLDKLHYPEAVLSSLVDQHTEVCLSLTYTSEELVKSFARAAAMYACPDSNDTRTSFREEINTARKQLSSAAAAGPDPSSALLYTSEKTTDTLHSSAVEASRAAQLSDYREVLVKYNPWILWKVGIRCLGCLCTSVERKKKAGGRNTVRLELVLEREVQKDCRTDYTRWFGIWTTA